MLQITKEKCELEDIPVNYLRYERGRQDTFRERSTGHSPFEELDSVNICLSLHVVAGAGWGLSPICFCFLFLAFKLKRKVNSLADCGENSNSRKYDQ